MPQRLSFSIIVDIPQLMRNITAVDLCVSDQSDSDDDDSIDLKEGPIFIKDPFIHLI